MKQIIYILLFWVAVVGCTNNNSEDSQESNYSDGTYCADVTYTNPNTGTSHTYKLNVEIENSELVKIYCSADGWLDESHFVSQEIDKSGFCSFTSDKGYNFEVQITGEECHSNDRRKLESDEEVSSCPSCGGVKDNYDTYCYQCIRKNEDEEKQKDKAEHTCRKCGKYDSYMYSVYEDCSDCKEKEDKLKRIREEEEEQVAKEKEERIRERRRASRRAREEEDEEEN